MPLKIDGNKSQMFQPSAWQHCGLHAFESIVPTSVLAKVLNYINAEVFPADKETKKINIIFLGCVILTPFYPHFS